MSTPSLTIIHSAFLEGFKAGSRGGQSIDAAWDSFSNSVADEMSFREAWEQIYPEGKPSEAVRRANKLLLSITGREGGCPRINWYLLRNRIADALTPIGDADAHLIAASPDLLEALKKAEETLKTASRQLTEDHRMVLMGRGWGWRTLAAVEAAISKATA